MAKGDMQLMMSLALVLVGSSLFLGGMGSMYWVQDTDANHTLHCGLWKSCQNLNGSSVCSTIAPGTSKAYFEATRVLESFALLVYCLTLFSCFTADDRHPSQSCSVCVRRYIHIVAALTAGGLTFLVIVVFAACYKDDDWFLQPALGYSYWLTFASCLCITAGGIMRIVFIVWPDRPALPTRKRSRHAPPAPGKRKAKIRVDDELGSDPLPPPLQADSELEGQGGKAATKKRPSGIRAFFAKFYFNKSKRTESAEVSAISKTVREKIDGRGGRGAPSAESGPADTAAGNRTLDAVTAGRLKPALKLRKENDDDESLDGRHRRGRRKSREPSSRFKRKRRVGIVEPFTGYNIPPSPAPEMLDIEESHQGGVLADDHRSDVKSYELAVGANDLRARVVSTPPAVVFPPAGAVAEINHYDAVNTFVDNCRSKRDRDKGHSHC